METWNIVIDYPNYLLSNLGNIKNNTTNKLLKPSLHKSGYLVVQLFRNGKRKVVRLHRLIAQTFLGDVDDTKYIDHLDRNKLNNVLENLRVVTPLESVLNRGIWGKSKYKGAYYNEKRKDWRSQIRVDKKLINLGYYKTELECALAYNKYIEDYSLVGYLKNIILE